MDAIGHAIGNGVDAVANAIAAVVHTANVYVPGGFPIFVVLCVIGVLVGLATYRR